MACPHPGQKAALAGMEVWHLGQTNPVAAGFPGSDDSGSDNSPAIVFLSALSAHTVDLKGVAGRQVMVLAPDFLLHFPNLGRKKFDGRAALCAHHVVMAPPVVLMFVAGDAVVKGHFAGQAAIRQKLQCAVDGGESDARVFLLDQPMKLVRREMLASFQKRSQDGTALLGLLEPDPLEVSQEDALSFADILPRNRWLIVDSFLQHGVDARTDALQTAFMILGERRLSQLEGKDRSYSSQFFVSKFRFRTFVIPRSGSDEESAVLQGGEITALRSRRS